MRGIRIAVLLGERTNPFWTEMKHHYEMLAPQNGFEIECFWPFEEMDEHAQLRRLNEILKLDFDVIVINPISDRNLIEGIFKAVEKGIWVIDVGEKTHQSLVEKAKPFYVPLKTVDFYQQGVIGATYIIQQLKNFGPSGVAIVEGRKRALQSIKRSQGAMETFYQNPSVTLVRMGTANFDRGFAKDLARKWMEEISSIKAFFCVNDNMALGVVEALRPLHSPEDLIIVGVDLIPESVEAIRKGLLHASVAFSTEAVVRLVLESMKKILKGEKLPDRFGVESRVVDRNNVDAYFEYRTEKKRKEI
jgi:ABC-type sugar transport system substrate-binding protein